MDDSADEAAGAVTVAVGTGTGYGVHGTDSSASVTVNDNDQPVVSIAAGAAVTEGGAATFTVTASPAPASALTVNLAVSQTGSFVASGDLGSKTVTVPPSGSATYTVATVDDSADEAAGAVTVAVGTGTGYGVHGTDSSASVTVNDNDQPVVSIAAGAAVTEGGAATFTVTASPAPASALTVNLTVSQTGSFVASGDLGSKTVTVPTSGSATYTVATVDDSAVEAAGSVTVAVGTGTGYGVHGTDSSASVTVNDDDQPVVSIAAGAAVTEGGAATFTVTASPAPASALTVNLTVSQTGSFVASGDLGSKTVTVPTSGSATYTVATVDDSAVEAAGSVTVAVGTGTGYGVHGTDSSASVTVNDDDQPVVSIAAGAAVTEGGAATFTVTASPAPASALTVNLTVSQTGSFVASGDLGSKTVTVPTSGSATYTVATVDDSAVEAAGSVTVAVGTGTGYGVHGTDSSASVTVNDNDDAQPTTPVVSITGGGAVTEGGAATFTVTASPSPASALTVNLTVSQTGSFVASGDLGSKTVTVPPSGSATYTVATVDDSADEAAGAVTVAVGTGTGYGVHGTDSSASVTVNDNDDAQPTTPVVSITGGGAVTEGGAATFTVTASPSPASALTVNLTVSQTGSFMASGDLGSKTVTVPPSGSATYTVATVDDSVDEPNGSVTATVGTGTGYRVHGTNSSASVTVRDNDEERPPNRAPIARPGADQTVDAGTAVTLDGSASTDPDGDVLTFVWTQRSGTRVTLSGAATARASFAASETAGALTFLLTVTDPAGLAGSDTVRVTIVARNRPPAFVSSEYAFELREEIDGSRRPVDLGAVAAEDMDDDELTYELASGDRSRFAVGERDGVVRYVGLGEDFESEPNRYDLSVRASDPHGATARARVMVTVTNVNELPEAEDDEADADEDQAVTVDVLANDTDPDGDRLRVDSVSVPAHGTATVTDGGVLYTPAANYHGPDRFTYVVVDGSDGAATAAVEVTVMPVNDAPTAVGVIPDQALDVGGGEATVELGPFFEDVDGDTLAYRASSSDPSVVAATVSGAVLTLAPVGYGSATVTVTAEDGGGLAAAQAFAVGVSDGLARRAVSDTLAGMARSHLASARMTLGRRVTAGRSEATGVTVLGRAVPLGTAAARTAAEQVMAGWLPAASPYGALGGAPGMGAVAGGGFGTRRPGAALTGRMRAAGTGFGAWASGSRGRGVMPMAAPGMSGLGAAVHDGRGSLGGLGTFGGFGGGADPLRGSEFLLALGAGEDAEGEGGSERPWQVWGQGDVQTFQGAPSGAAGYDGQLRTVYLGVDTWLTDRWMVGVAVARSAGDGDWRAGGSRGSLKTTLTAAHPYMQWSDGTTSVWATAGGGWGAVENRRASGRRGESGLGLRLALVELRRGLGSAGGVEFGVRGDAAWAELRTEAGGETIDGQTAAVNQARVGVEVLRPVRLGGLVLAPFTEVHVRRDGGAGQTGEGAEVAGGLRATAGKVRVDAQGRLLVVHSAEGYRERGVGLTLSVGNQDREGLSLSVSPRWGDSAAAGGALWREQVYGRYAPAAADAWELDARGGYGVPVLGDRLLTWFGSLRRSAVGGGFFVGGQIDMRD